MQIADGPHALNTKTGQEAFRVIIGLELKTLINKIKYKNYILFQLVKQHFSFSISLT